METMRCQLCSRPIDGQDDAYCHPCRQMDLNLKFLIEAHPAEAQGYLSRRFNQLADQLENGSDRRRTFYTPPKGTHTPERRHRIRRLKHTDSHPKRRKSDRSPRQS